MLPGKGTPLADRSAPIQAPAKAEPGRASPRQAAPHVPRFPWAPARPRGFPLHRGSDAAPVPEAAREAPETDGTLQLKGAEASAGAAAPPPKPPPPPNRTGLPDALKAGVEALSGLAMGDVRVHRNSTEPAKLGALAYAQGSDIHLGPGQEQHLPHEAWHVVQQKQGRVKTSRQPKRDQVHADSTLEAEADRMGQAAAAGPPASVAAPSFARRPAPTTVTVTGDASFFPVQPKLMIGRPRGERAADGSASSSSAAAAAGSTAASTAAATDGGATGGRAEASSSPFVFAAPTPAAMEERGATGREGAGRSSAAASSSSLPAFAPAATDERATAEADGGPLRQSRTRLRARISAHPYSDRPDRAQRLARTSVTAAEATPANPYGSIGEVVAAMRGLGKPATVAEPVIAAIPRLWADSIKRNFDDIQIAFREIVHEIAPVNAVTYLTNAGIRAGNTSQGIKESDGRSWLDAYQLQLPEFQRRVQEPLLAKYRGTPAEGMIFRHIEGMASVLLKSGNCDEFSSIIMMRLMEQVTDQWVGKASMGKEMHRFIVLSRTPLAQGQRLSERHVNETVVDGWDNRKVMTVEQYAGSRTKLNQIKIEEAWPCTGADVITDAMTKDLEKLLTAFQAKLKRPMKLFKAAKAAASAAYVSAQQGGDDFVDDPLVGMIVDKPPMARTDTRRQGSR